MKTSKKVLAVLLTIATLIGIFSCATTVFAEEYNEYADKKAYQESLLTEAIETEKDNAEIICEVPEKRDEFSKTYKRSDGSFTTVFSKTPLHKLNNGEWEEINNTLKQSGETITNTDGAFDVEFPETINENEKITISAGEESISFSVNDVDNASADIEAPETTEEDIIKKDLEKTVSQITYENVDDNTDIQYIVSSGSVKENIIVSNKESLKEAYSFEIEKGELSAELDNDNNLIFKNDKNETVFTIPAPVMTDADNAVSYDIQVQVENADKAVLTLTYIPSKEWLESEERAYPVIIDPVFVLGGCDGEFFEDTVIMNDSENPQSRETNYVDSFEGYISDNSQRKSEVLVKFNMSKFDYLKSDNIEVTAVNTCFNGMVNKSNLLAKAVNGSYDLNTVTYNDVYPQNNSEPVITYGETIDFFTGGAPEVDTADITGVYFDITDIFLSWLNGEENNGFAIVPGDNTTDAFLYLNGYAYDNNGKKVLGIDGFFSIDYVDTSCSNDSYEYLSQEIGRAGTAGVNTFSRSLSLSRSDLSMSGLRMPVDISFRYNTAYGNFVDLFNTMTGEESISFVYGNRWFPSYYSFLFEVGEKEFVLYTGEGTIATFYQKEETDQSGDGSATTQIIFEENETSDSGYTLELIDQEGDVDISNMKVTDLNGDTIYFNDNGYAVEIREEEPNADGSYDKISIFYDEETGMYIDYITDGIGRVYDFVYSSETGLLSEIKCLTAGGEPIKAGTTQTDLKVTYDYDSNGNLTSVTYPDGETVTYTYDSNGNLIKVQNIDGYNIQYTYDSLGKVTNIAEYAGSTPGNSIHLTQLSNRQVKVDDAYSGTQTYQFGKDGRLHYTFDDKGNYLKSDYAPANDENVFSSNDWSISSQNLLKNGGFEDVKSAKAVYWSKSFNVEDVDTSEDTTDYACRVNDIEVTTALQSQTIEVNGGKSYTFSLYAKSLLTDLTEEDRLYISITAENENGNKASASRQVAPTENFELYSVTISTETEIVSVTVEFGLKNKMGDFYVNNAQLEKGYGTAPFNYIKNGSFNNSNENWSTATIVDETLKGGSVKSVELSGGLPSYVSSDDDTVTIEDHISATTQSVEINGKKGETYSIGGWFKGYFDAGYNYDTSFASSLALMEPLTSSAAQLKVTYSYTDTVTTTDEATNETTTTEQVVTENFVVDFEPYNDDWQYAVDTFALKGDTESVDVTVMAKNVPSDCFATGIELTLDDSSTLLESEEETTTETETANIISLAEETTDSVEECLCEDCEEFNCSCRCASEALCNCVQCKRGTTKEYDNYGNVVSTVKTDGVLTMKTETNYSTDGNSLAGAKDENGVVSTFTESAEKDTSLPLQVSVAGRTSDYTFNAGTHLETVNKTVNGLVSGNQMQVAYGYDNDKITKVTTNGYSYNFEYDKMGNIATEKVGNQVIANYYYGSNQHNKQLSHILYENGQFVWYDYDSLGNVSGIKYSNDADWRFTFEYTNSEKTTITDNVQNYLKEITEKGFIITDLTTDRIIYSKTDTTESFNGAEYIKTDNDEVYEQADGSTLQSYVLSGIANSTKTLGFSKLTDWFGRDKKKTVSVNGSALSLEKEFKYKDGAEENATTKYIEEISNSIKNNDTVNSAETLKYTYDIHGNVKTVSSCVNNVTTMQYEYYYDEANQIVRVDDYINNITTTYQYDMGGNIVFAKEFERDSYSAESVVISEDVYVYDSTWKDKISRVNGKAMTYDLIGNLLTYDGKTLTWIAGRKLETFQNADYALSFTYDENGLRSSKTVNHNGTSKTIKYTWVDGKLIGQMDGTDTLRFIYDDSEEIVGLIKNDSEIYLYIKNIFGDIIGIVDETGSVVVEYEYDVWGNLMSVSGSLAQTLGQLNPIRYRGYYYDSESGYYYLQSRYYDPELRRFINADKLENLYEPKNTYLYADSVNTFSYCANSPVNMVDYSGEKEADNTSNYLANALVFSIGLISYDKAIKIKLDKFSKGDLYKDSKKGKIEVHLTLKKNKVMLSDYMKPFKSALGNKVYDGLAVFCLEKFYDDFADKFNDEYETDIIKRPFLFSKSCVSYEIQRHDEVYRTCRNTNKTGLLSDYVAKTLVELSKFLTSKGATVDILEQDVLKSFDEGFFNYYEGIASCYQKTKADPYWNGTERDEDYTRPKWKKTRIPYNP